ncbi:transglycosylase SLT domain-containing protein [Candidatus Woesearchaeota archaeon]|nr:transglycosylase SLT domain-containing protein [Candidatus Woesearchaeota archaeon]
MSSIDEIVGSNNLAQAKISRRDFLNSLWQLGGAILLTVNLPSEAYAQRRRKRFQEPQHKHIDYSKVPVPNVGYKELVKEPKLSGISLHDRDTDVGKIQRVMRWSNLTATVESRYGIPKNYLLGMIGIESYGDPTLPNLLGDGGAGLSHMQPLLASKYGLQLITDSRRLRDFEQGRKLKQAINEVHGDLKELINYDDRFHPIKNVDAAARMLCDLYQKTHSWDSALERYAGRRNYDSRVRHLAEAISSGRVMRIVRFNFNNSNINAKAYSKSIDFDGYVKLFHNLNRNYGLDEYKKLKRHPVR